ncbi:MULTISPECIES: hypothetical protein [Pseudomonadaceae]|jgi:hypothetical protein|uniref:Uncharacterized protein n=1 Tax=Stutzerimonas stutzeri TaxID=316 RepID=A0ABD4XWF1_STUST|nr:MULTISPECIES: hypothetical protein [Pseudomonadaceae]MDH0687013.1 hypothetical protein [Stutzerimonas stutzeri]MDS9629052.1 hypothetical protein [Pseudomonas aeruginosa]NRF46923.1 hypothetical protein [Stutzerimonas stutzeri]HBP1341902.1 hypothetical protein [Pseudomonas aeruginosa]
MTLRMTPTRFNLLYMAAAILTAVLLARQFGTVFALGGILAYGIFVLLEILYVKLPRGLQPFAPWLVLAGSFAAVALGMIIAGSAFAENAPLETPQPPKEVTAQTETADEAAAGAEAIARIYLLFQQELAERAKNKDFDQLKWMQSMQGCLSDVSAPSITPDTMSSIAECADKRLAMAQIQVNQAPTEEVPKQ